MGHMIAAMRVGEEAFGAFRRPFDRPSADALRGPYADDLLGIDEDLRAEAAADIGRDDAQFVLRRQAMEGRDHEARHMRVLARRVERIMVAAGIPRADGGSRLHRIGDEPVVDDVELGHVMGAREGSLGRRLVAQRPFEHGVVGRHVVNLRLGLRRLAGIDDMRQHLIGDIHPRGRGFRLLLALGDDDGDMVADIAYLALRQDRMRSCFHRRAVFGMDHPAADEPADLVLSDMLAGENRNDAVFRFPFRYLDRLDRGMGVRASHEIGVGLILEIDVVGILALAGDETMIFLALHASADSGVTHDVSSSSRSCAYIFSAPAWMALTMLW